MKTRASTDILRYWQSLGRAGRIPLRNDIDPGAIRAILADVFILEVDEASTRRRRSLSFRLAGTRICSLFSRELRGMSFDSLWSSADLNCIDTISQKVLEEGVPARLTASSVTAEGDRIDVELMLLPLRSSEGRIDRIFGSLAPVSKPSWIGAYPLPFLTLDAHHHPAADVAVPEMQPRRAIARSFGTAPQTSPLREVIARVMHLSVLDGGKAR
jgi:hypothetical protein